jgi:hypothetical protein
MTTLYALLLVAALLPLLVFIMLLVCAVRRKDVSMMKTAVVLWVSAVIASVTYLVKPREQDNLVFPARELFDYCFFSIQKIIPIALDTGNSAVHRCCNLYECYNIR